MFKPVSSRVSFPDLEKAILQWWKEEDVFHRTEKAREGQPRFTFYEGPPTANGSPGIHHVLGRVFKDAICRYKTMKGFYCLRKGGWDTHGLAVEVEIEKELGLSNKREIENYGIERFNQNCRESVFRYVKEWETMTDRSAFWIDMKHPYVTLDNSYIETGWWIIKELWDRNLIYQGLKGTPHCPRCVTSLSSHEVAQGYQEDTPDPSTYVKFALDPPTFDPTTRIDSDVPTFIMAWTTTPWTLPGNTALAVDPTANYSIVELDQHEQRQRIIIATQLLDATIREDYQVIGGPFKGEILVGLQYQPLYDPKEYGVEVRKFSHAETNGNSFNGDPSVGTPELESSMLFQPVVVGADFVSMDDGTGIVHIAPAFGDEDLTLGRESGLHFIQQVDLQGKIVGTYPFSGKFVKEADEQIMDDLERRGFLYRREIYRHTYPFCWRCNAPLLYYAKSSWYIRTTSVKERLVSGNEEINWYPNHIKDGRFGEWLRNNVDWAISRERYWGTPMPVWKCTSCDHYHCIGSVAELKDMAFEEHKAKIDSLDLHRPFVDGIQLKCSQCHNPMKRIPEVLDGWFDSGAMPFAQWHYPFEGQSIEEDGRFPADYICEAVDQTRGWFYSLHALSILLMDRPCYRNVICLGLILDEKGQKMSKHVGNVVNPFTIMDEQGADATRWYLFTASQPGESRRFSKNLVTEVVRRFLLTLWNVYSFFVTYARIDQFNPEHIPNNWQPSSELDRWLISELNTLIFQVDHYLDTYNPTDAGRRIQEFVERLSNWYVRRSRRRFWKSENDEDKLSAYATLYTCLLTISKLIAPFTPFVAEEMYRNLTSGTNSQEPDSVHLTYFPHANESLIEKQLMDATRLAIQLSSMGRAARSKAGIKVRQPLSEMALKLTEYEEQILLLVSEQIKDELNVKSLTIISDNDSLYKQSMSEITGKGDTLIKLGEYWVSNEGDCLAAINTQITPELADEGLARELVHRIQNMRRSAQFDITDHITIAYQGPPRFCEVMHGYSNFVQQETLSESLIEQEPAEGFHVVAEKINDMEVILGVKKV